ncbi:MAG: DNA polymerase I [Synergistaceae bacterium]|jgi:DNA polymerase-1|nr:DNA polymerase I [Synergistaceae bacterium]
MENRMDENTNNRVLIVDGHGLAFRAFYAVPPLNAPDGTPTNAILGFMNMLTKVEADVSPADCAVVFDAPGPTFRHELYKEYKAGRKPTPEEFKPQIPLLRELLTALGYPVVMEFGVEADDVIASLALDVARRGGEAVIVSSDKDLFQVLGPGVKMLRPIKGITTLKEYDEGSFAAEFGFPPLSMPDYLALLGDASDNVPGVAGIGEKTALQLIGTMETLERLFESLDGQENKTSAVSKKLVAGRESAFRSRELIRLKIDLPLSPSLSKTQPNLDEVFAFCKRLGLAKLMDKLKVSQAQSQSSCPQLPSNQALQGVSGVPADVSVEVMEAGKAVNVGDNGGDKRGEFEEVGFESLLDGEELSIAILRSGKPEKYPPEPGSVELQLADAEGRYAVLRGLEIAPDLWTRLSGKKLFVNDYKDLAACFGARRLERCKVWDLKTAHYLLHPDKPSHALEDLPHRKLDQVPALALRRAARELNLEIRRYERLPELMEQVDLPLIPVLVDMERGGIRLSPRAFIELQRELEERVADIEKEIAAAAGADDFPEEINLNSPKQVAWLLFERLGLPSGAKTKGKTGFSTSASVLESLAALNLPHSDVPRLMLEHRELSKMLSGFVVPLQRAANTGGGVVHTTFEAAFTGTGRLSSRDPNLQNLPAFGHWSRRIKEGLIPKAESASESSRVFVAADYSQIELRVLAHLSGEERLQEAFRKGGRDIHRETAAWVFSTPPEDVTPELRRVAKMINFGLLYGMSSFGLGDRLGIGRSEARGIISRYFAALPRVKQYLEESAATAQTRGYTRTLFGRIRPIGEAMEGVRDRNGLKRIAVNTPIQGTAADIARKAMIDFDRCFAPGGDVRLFLQIHDSLVCECPQERAEEVGEALARVMKSAAALSVPLEVDLKTGRSLADV